MRSMMAVCAAFSLLMAGAVPVQAQTQDLCTWTPSYLPLPAGVTGGAVWAAGSNGYLAGQATNGMLLLWHNGELVDVDAPVSTSIDVSGVNGSGEIVGWDGRSRTAFVYRDGSFQTLPSPPGSDASASAINDAGDIVGIAYGFPVPYRSVVWKRNQPGTYQIIADDVAVGIDNAGHVVTEKGLVWSPDGTTSRLAGSPNLQVQLFQHGHALGHTFGDYTGMHKWDTMGSLVYRYEAQNRPTPRGINSRGQLVAWYTPTGGTAGTLGVWREATFVGNVPAGERVYAVMETGELAGQRRSADDRTWVPATWTCS
ncbi:hypothetical protein KIPE111705_22010 [Kibdelosporangium persicum]|uniref:Uncharacterized protein n=1 Tax=Kibdelosporangium persicum TaxID=2698649 RepID=A0ABX2FDJ2_9PSEU|nr:hypothetical protein [Kibdelosporangium persicum]NRN69432.1 hypothetical protein [Kibdelosporangium persicum]